MSRLPAGEFQINDIVLDIPPSQIHVQKSAINHSWQTLRTRSSIKAKSPWSVADISCVVNFTGSYLSGDIIARDLSKGAVNGYEKLRALVSQLRLTPFCYVENQFLRDTMLKGSPNKSMALALKQMEIRTDPAGPEVLIVTLKFAWFNYSPYIENFVFREHLFSSKPVVDPRESVAWKLFYEAEQKKNHYAQAPDKLTTDMIFSYTEFRQLEISERQALRKEVQALKQLKEDIESFSGTESYEGLQKATIDSLKKELHSDKKAATLSQEVFGLTTSMMTNVPGYEQGHLLKTLGQVVDNQLDPETTTKYAGIVDEEAWKYTIINSKTGKSIVTAETPADKKEDGKQETSLLLEREAHLFTGSSLIPTGVSISFENMLAMMPVVGHSNPTYQHIGSIDAVVTISFQTTDTAMLQEMAEFYDLVEGQDYSFRLIPSGQRNIRVSNTLLNMLGLREFIPEKLWSSTIPGQPGTSEIMLQLVNNPLTSTTREKITPPKSLSLRAELRKDIIKILGDSVVLNQNFRPHRDLSVSTIENKVLNINPRASESLGKFGKRYKEFFSVVGSREELLQRIKLRYTETMNQTWADSLHWIQVEKIGLRLSQLGGGGGDGGKSFTPVFGGVDRFKKVEATFAERYLKTVFSLDENTVLGIAKFKENLVQDVAKTQEDTASELTEKMKSVEADDVTISFVAANLTSAIGWKSTVFSRHQKAMVALADEVIESGLMDLSPFKSIFDKLSKGDALLAGSNNCYPDFPMTETISLLGESGNKSSLEAINSLRKTASDQNVFFKGLGLSSFINPDFYIFGGINESGSSIITPGTLEAAVGAIKDGHKEKRGTAEINWIEKYYKIKVIGEERDRLVRAKADGEILNKEDFVSGSLRPTILEKPGIQSKKIALDQDSNPDLVKMNLKLEETTFGSENGANPSSPTVVHKLGLDVLDNFGPGDVWANKTHNDNPNIERSIQVSEGFPDLDWPVLGQKGTTWRVTRSATDYVGGAKTTHPITGKPEMHQGVDIGGPKKGGKTLKGVPVYAAGNGVITKIGWNDGFGYRVRIRHSKEISTVYAHMEGEAVFQKLLKRYLDFNKRGRRLQVRKGDQLGTVGNTGRSDGPHLHYEIRGNGSNATAPHYNPETYPSVTTDGVPHQSPTDSNAITPGDSILGKSLEQLESDIRGGQGPSLMRAYPTFKLYFIESDATERKQYAFDDFFSYSAVKEIEIIKNRKVAADLCIIQLTNISGVLTNRKFRSTADPDAARTEAGDVVKETLDPGEVGTDKENPIASLMMQPGIKVQLRLGYSNNPEELEKVFNGRIVEAYPSEDDDLITIICQSDAIELVQTVQGEVKRFGGWLTNSGDTADIMEQLLGSPDVVSFGRWIPNFNAKNSGLNAFTNRWRFFSTPSDDNIWAPTGAGFRDLLYSPKYIMYQTTIWDAMQEMTLRHPGYICRAVPYDGKYGPRMTLFFGIPDQLYLSRDQSLQEEISQGRLDRETIEKLNTSIADVVRGSLKDPNLSPELEEMLADKIAEATRGDSPTKDFLLDIERRKFALKSGFVRPFRRYHVLTSGMHILHNNINNASHNAFNTVTMQYEKGTLQLVSDSSGRPELAFQGEAQVDLETGSLKFDTADTFTLKADQGIPDEDTREMFAQFPNCIGEPQAVKYALSLLKLSLKEGYKGSVVSIGNPSINPYDICYIFDEYNDTYGPVEVEQVIHRLSQKSGFITEVTPDMCVHVNELSTMATQDVMGLVTEGVLRQTGMLRAARTQSVVGTIATNLPGSPLAMMTTLVVDPFKFAGVFIFRKLFTRTQLAHPFRYSPLVKNGKPMLGGVSFIRQTGGSFIQKAGDWFTEVAEGGGLLADDLYDSYGPPNFINRQTGSVSKWFSGQER